MAFDDFVQVNAYRANYSASLERFCAPSPSTESIDQPSTETIAQASTTQATSREKVDAQASQDCNGTVTIATNEIAGSVMTEIGQLTKEKKSFWRRLAGKPNTYCIERPVVNGFIALMIVLNSVCMGLEADYGNHSEWDTFFAAAKHYFCVLWITEATFRILAHKCEYFRDRWNVLDFFLVWLAIADAWVLPSLLASAANYRLMTMLRLLRLLRLARLVRLLRFFKELWLLVHGLVMSMKTLSWVAVLLVCITYAAALVMRQRVGDWCGTDTYTIDDFPMCKEMFGSLIRTMYTLFQVVTLDSWSSAVVRPILKNTPGNAMMIIVFLFVTSFGVLNIVVGVVVETTLQVARENEELLTQEREARRKHDKQVFLEILAESEVGMEGTISRTQFVKRVSMAADFKRLGLPQHKSDEIFQILDVDGVGELSVGALITGCWEMKEEVVAKDMMLMAMDLRTVRRRVEKVEGLLGGPTQGEEYQKLCELRRAFDIFDMDGSRDISRKEFDWICSQEDVLKTFRSLNIWAPADELAVLFDVLDANRDGRIDIEEFIKGIQLLRGAADAKRQLTCIADAGKLSRRHSVFKNDLDRIDSRLDCIQDWQDAVGQAFTPLLGQQVQCRRGQPASLNPCSSNVAAEGVPGVVFLDDPNERMNASEGCSPMKCVEPSPSEWPDAMHLSTVSSI